MNWGNLTGDDIRTAQFISVSAMVLWFGVGVLPGLRNHGGMLRGWILGLYLAACVGFTLYLLLR